MKKAIKKLAALSLVGALAVGMNAMVFAEDPASVPTEQTIDSGSAPDATTGKYTISVASTDDHTYTVYQILKGTLIPGEQKLGNPEWGSDAIGAGDVDAFIKDVTEATGNTAINNIVEAQLKNDAQGIGPVSSKQSLDVEPGYYLIVDTTEGVTGGEAYSLNIVAVFNDITITPKKGKTTSEKHVDDQNDSDAGDHSELKDSADYDIGDTIPYTLTFTLPADYANYERYYVQFVDDMSAGLTYNGDAKIQYGNGEFSSVSFTPDATVASAYTNGTVYKYEIADLKTAATLNAGDTITIKYTATLNGNAVTGEVGNPNKYKVVYNNNPNKSGEGESTGDTPWDVNIVFTYKTVFNKVDGDGKPLTGADFTLYKFVESDGGEDKYNNKTGAWTDVTALNSNSNTNPSKAKETLTNDNGTAAEAKFSFTGLDAGVYKLVESTTPEGYNTLEDQIFTITAEHDLVSADPQLTSLAGTDGAQFKMTPLLSDGSLTTDVENNQGAELPSTGGMGTTIFYIIGGVLVLAAAIVLISKRRVQQ